MVTDTAREDALLELLNTTPLIDGAIRDRLTGPGAAAWQRAHGGDGSEEERVQLVRARDTLQDVVRGRLGPASLVALLEDVSRVPRATGEGIDWELRTPPERAAAVRAILTWDHLRQNR